jgi:hypothetical protein
MTTNTTPTPQELAEAIESLQRMVDAGVFVDATTDKMRTLLAYARAPRLTEEQTRDTTTATYFHIELYYRRGCNAVGYSIKDGSAAHLVHHDRAGISAQLRRLAQCLDDGEYPFAAFPEVEQGGGK